ncbi:MAG: hypothetical protein GX102_04780 [Porphyromonadaceae bacterium]|nr:hypothetical protein [Porphyromonadaceae bacterium]
MPTYIEINGIDEAGYIGQPIFFTRVNVGIKNEIQLFLRNLNHFNTLMPNKFKLKSYDPTYLLKYVTELLDDSTIKIEIYRMPPHVQLHLTNFLAVTTATELHQKRMALVNVLDNEGKLKDKTNSAASLYKTTDFLKRFKNPKIWIESFVKSYGMMMITKELGTNSKYRKKPPSETSFSDYFSVSQIAGGYPFAFWWRSLMDKGHFEKGAFIVNGIANGDEYYPSMSCAGTISSTLLKNQDKLHLFPIKTIEYQEAFDLSEFYAGHSRALETPIFQKRIIFIGQMDENLRMCIPYLNHLRDIHYTPEATSIQVPIEWFFKARGYGNPDNTTIIHSSSLSQQDKTNLDFCKKKTYPISHVCDYKEDFIKLLTEIEQESEYAPLTKRNKIAGTLKQIENLCLKNMR